MSSTQFATQSRPHGDAGQRCQHVGATCCVCHKTTWFPFNDRMNNNIVAMRFRNAGWDVGKDRSRDYCPEHAPAAVKEARRRKLAYLHMNPRPGKGQAVVAKSELKREPTQPERRRIMEYLTTVYEEDRYVGSHSDASVAAQLNLPRAWIADIRASFFGEDKNHDQDAALLTVETVRQELDTLETSLLELLAKIDARIKELRGLIEKFPKVKTS